MAKSINIQAKKMHSDFKRNLKMKHLFKKIVDFKISLILIVIWQKSILQMAGISLLYGNFKNLISIADNQKIGFWFI
jgi:hypothetical protein